MALNSLLNENLLQNYLIKTPRYLAIQRHYFWVHMPQCGIFRIFLLFIFYVKSRLVNLEHQKTANSTITRLECGKILQNAIMLKYIREINFFVNSLVKRRFDEKMLNYPQKLWSCFWLLFQFPLCESLLNLISRKIWVPWNFHNSHTVHTLYVWSFTLKHN